MPIVILFFKQTLFPLLYPNRFLFFILNAHGNNMNIALINAKNKSSINTSSPISTNVGPPKNSFNKIKTEKNREKPTMFLFFKLNTFLYILQDYCSTKKQTILLP